jgi:hypothetical protein
MRQTGEIKGLGGLVVCQLLMQLAKQYDGKTEAGAAWQLQGVQFGCSSDL